MTISLKQLVTPQQLGTFAAVYFKASVLTRIDRCTLSNSTAGAITVSTYIVPSMATADVTNTIDPTVSVGAHAVISSAIEGHTLNIGDSIYALASAGASITIMASGITQT